MDERIALAGATAVGVYALASLDNVMYVASIVGVLGLLMLYIAVKHLRTIMQNSGSLPEMSRASRLQLLSVDRVEQGIEAVGERIVGVMKSGPDLSRDLQEIKEAISRKPEKEKKRVDYDYAFVRDE